MISITGKEGLNTRDIVKVQLAKHVNKYSLNMKIKRKRVRKYYGSILTWAAGWLRVPQELGNDNRAAPLGGNTHLDLERFDFEIFMNKK